MNSRPLGGCVRIGPLLLGLVVVPIAACIKGPEPARESALHPVSGRVTVGGRPAEGVEVRLYPLNHYYDSEAPHPFATTDEEGRFRLGMGDGRDGAPNGQYVATLVWPSGRGGTDRLGGTYTEPDGSGLTALIDDSTTELPPLEVGTAASRKAGPRRPVK